ncbi:MAG: hypothetical protein AAFX87_01785 [Bacteroidota bacterium]
MFRKRKLIKVISMFFLLEMLFDLGHPIVSYALTAGPTAPEYTSFEPVDTTDMVNMLNGDFVYNMPIMEVPGPNGGYPLSLSYHGGIKNDQESTWVGLGWNINPGAINRSVQGFVDDSNGEEYKTLDYSDGGESTTTTYNLSLSKSLNGGVTSSLNFSLSTTRDTYEGISRGFSLSKGSGYTPGNNPFTPRFSRTLGITSSGGNVSAFVSDRVSGSVLGSVSTGASLSSKGLKSFTGSSADIAANNNTAGRLSSYTRTETKTGGLGSPIGVVLDITKKYTRYWSSETAVMKTYGSLYPENGNGNLDSDRLDNTVLITHSGDIYNLYDDVSNSIAEENNPELQIGGTFLNYDNYQVLGQGVGGAIEPYVAENGDLYGQSNYSLLLNNGLPNFNNPILKYKTLGKQFEIDKVDFRFLGDYSNRVDVNASDIIADGTEIFSTTAHDVTGHNDGIRINGKEQRIAGSRDIQWFTNEEITLGVAKAQGFVDFYQDPLDRKLDYEVYDNYLQPESGLPYCLSSFQAAESSGYNEPSFVDDLYCDDDGMVNCPSQFYYKSLKPKNYDLRKKIGGFKVTNESGVTYHYALPVYNYNEYSRTRLKETRENIPEHRENFNQAPYAYTWLLTAVTGPDFVDRNTNGVLDDEDWGYWVKFDYGMWTDSYQWRTPHQGYAQDINADVMTFTYGMKELYYLDAVETKSHIALFVKSKRKDGRGVTSRLEGGSNPREYSMVYRDRFNSAIDLGRLNYYVAPVATMKLDGIYLLDKDHYASLGVGKSTGSKYQEATIDNPHRYNYIGNDVETPTGSNIRETEDFVYVKYHNGQLVLDDDDVANILDAPGGLKESSLRVVNFNYDYSLAQGVTNSIGYFSDFDNYEGSFDCFPLGQDIEVPLNDYAHHLRQYDPFCGNVGVYQMYAENSGYLNRNPIGSSPFCSVRLNGENGGHTSLPKSGGQNTHFHKTGKLTLLSVDMLGKRGESVVPPYNFEYAKNPAYKANHYDEWGYYKSDFEGSSLPANISANRNDEGWLVVSSDPTEEQKAVLPYSREVTENSANNVDAWSLTKVTSPLGAEINIDYEADEYVSVLNNAQQYEIETLEQATSTNRIVLKPKEKSSKLLQSIVGTSLDLKVLILDELKPTGLPFVKSAREHIIDDLSGTVINVSQGDIIVDHPLLYDLLSPSVANIDGATYDVVPHVVSAFIVKNSVTHRGGGIRVSRISLKDGFSGREVWTKYDYKNKNTGLTSGVSAFKPYNAVNVSYDVHNDFFYNSLKSTDADLLKVFDRARNTFQMKANETNAKVMANITEVPAGVYYEFVTTQTGVNEYESDFKDQYRYTVFSEDLVRKTRTPLNTPIADHKSARLELENYTHRIGNLEKQERINASGEVIYRLTNNYLLDSDLSTFEENLKNQKQGVIEQSAHKHFKHTKFYVTDFEPPYEYEQVHSYHRALVSKRSDYVDVLTGTIEEDLRNGIVTKTDFLEFDFFSGQATKTLVNDSYGNHILSETTPAYHKYPAMGISLNGGFNMLTQEAENKTYTVDNPDELNPRGLIAASVQTWSPTIDQLNMDNTPKGLRYYSTPLTENTRRIGRLSGDISIGDRLIVSYLFNDYRLKVIDQLNSTDFEVLVIDGPIPLLSTGYLDFTATNFTTFRKHRSYVYLGNDISLSANGLYPYGSFSEFISWGRGEQPISEQWQKNSEITLYDPFSHALEASDVNGNYMATKMDRHQEQVYATVANASYDEFAYSGAEDISGGNATLGGGVTYQSGNFTQTPSNVHTGRYAVSGNPGEKTFTFHTTGANSGRTYAVSVWSSQPDPLIKYAMNGVVATADPLPVRQAGNWYLLRANIESTSNEIEVWAEASGTMTHFDDFRFHPLDAAMTSYVYNEWRELTHILDANNVFTEYKYDPAGRLAEIWRETFDQDNDGINDGKVKVSANEINYARNNGQ